MFLGHGIFDFQHDLENVTRTGSRRSYLLLPPSVSWSANPRPIVLYCVQLTEAFPSYHIRIRPNQFSYPEEEAVRFSETSQNLTFRHLRPVYRTGVSLLSRERFLYI